MGISPITDLLMHLKIFFILGSLISIQSGNDGFGLRPPELHVLRIVLNREVAAIAEIDDATILFVPAPVPRPFQYLKGHLYQFLIPTTMTGFFHNEPRGFDAMTGINNTAVTGVDKLTFRPHHLEHCLELGMHEIAANG